MNSRRSTFDPDYCEKRCPICTRARRGVGWAKALQVVELLITCRHPSRTTRDVHVDDETASAAL